jgi:hypothetical protein
MDDQRSVAGLEALENLERLGSGLHAGGHPGL